MKHTKIEWVDSTVNPVMGCDGCELWDKTVKICYAGQLTERYGGHSKGYPKRFEDVTLFPGRMAETLKWKDLTGTDRPDKPWLNGHPRMIFVSDMGDALSASVPFAYLEKEIVRTAHKSPHTYLWLTKRPSRMAAFAKFLPYVGSTWPANLWPGTSVTDQPTANARIPQILKVPGKIFLSVEPLLAPVHFNSQLSTLNSQLALAIFGGESGDKARPCNLKWIRDGMAPFIAANIPVFVKQLGSFVVDRNDAGFEGDEGEWPMDTRTTDLEMAHWAYQGAPVRVRLKSAKGGDMAEWPKDLQLRQFPKP